MDIYIYIGPNYLIGDKTLVFISVPFLSILKLGRKIMFAIIISSKILCEILEFLRISYSPLGPALLTRCNLNPSMDM